MEQVSYQDSNQDFRKFLQSEFVRRCEKNSRYSLRAYAQSLQVSHATLSHILRGQRQLTEKMVLKLSQQLEVSPHEIVRFQNNISENKNKRFSLSSRYHELTMDAFAAISDWYHDAIVELSNTKNFKSDPRWIAKVLSISVSEVNMAIERLVRLELLEIKATGEWVDLSRDNTTPISPDFTTAALKKYQRKILELSLNALENTPKSEREHVSNMMAFQSSDLPEVRKRINKFRSRLSKFIQRKESKPDQVYQLAVSFFSLTNKEKMGD